MSPVVGAILVAGLAVGCANLAGRDAPIAAGLERTTPDSTRNAATEVENREVGTRWACGVSTGGIEFTATGTTLSEAQNRVRASCTVRFPDSSCRAVDCRANP